MNQAKTPAKARAKAPATASTNAQTPPSENPEKRPTFGQCVLVLQGGGALGAYQFGVYQAMHEAGIEPDWIVGTSIGAINGAIIAGNRPENRLARLSEFWQRMEIDKHQPMASWGKIFGNTMINAGTIHKGIPGFFAPNPLAALGSFAPVGIENASYYTTEPLRKTLQELVDVDYINSKALRLTVGAVNANTGKMRYFDSQKNKLAIDHVMASGALPPAFPAVRIDGEPYWDGGIYSNTPIEVVLDDNPRRNSTIVAVQLWNPANDEPNSLQKISDRQKDIQFSTRDNSHIERQQQNHKLRHIIRDMNNLLPKALQDDPKIRKLAAWGCSTLMHIVRLHAPRIRNEDAYKDIDFTEHGIKTRWQAGYEDGQRMVETSPWNIPSDDPSDGVIIHEVS